MILAKTQVPKPQPSRSPRRGLRVSVAQRNFSHPSPSSSWEIGDGNPGTRGGEQGKVKGPSPLKGA